MKLTASLTTPGAASLRSGIWPAASAAASLNVGNWAGAKKCWLTRSTVRSKTGLPERGGASAAAGGQPDTGRGARRERADVSIMNRSLPVSPTGEN